MSVDGRCCLFYRLRKIDDHRWILAIARRVQSLPASSRHESLRCVRMQSAATADCGEHSFQVAKLRGNAPIPLAIFEFGGLNRPPRH